MKTATLQKLTALTQTLKLQARAFDKQYPAQSRMAFDDWLFNQSHRFLTPYFTEIEHNIAELATCAKQQQLEEVTYISEIVENQLGAVIKLMHHPVTEFNRGSSTTLYDELHQLKVWEARLTRLVAEKKQEYFAAGRNANAETRLLATEQRLKRCQVAIEQLQKKLPNLEKNQEQNQESLSPQDKDPNYDQD
jgi:primosomal replication protein N''